MNIGMIKRVYKNIIANPDIPLLMSTVFIPHHPPISVKGNHLHQ
jgi:hypothetical protein